MAVEPDLSDTRGLKREVWMLLTWKSLKSVHSFPMLTRTRNLDEFEEETDFSRDQDNGPLLTFKWVRTVKERRKKGMPNYSGFENASKQSDLCCQCDYCCVAEFRLVNLIVVINEQSVMVFATPQR